MPDMDDAGFDDDDGGGFDDVSIKRRGTFLESFSVYKRWLYFRLS